MSCASSDAPNTFDRRAVHDELTIDVHPSYQCIRISHPDDRMSKDSN